MLTQSASYSSAAQQCVGADGTEVIGRCSRLTAAAQLRRYLENEVNPEVGCVRDRIRLRVKQLLDDVLIHGDYEKVTLLAHSHGVTIAVDLLADYQSPRSVPIRLMSLGGLMELYSYKASWVLEESEKCVNNASLSSWTDYYSTQDWLCTKTPTPRSMHNSKFESQLIRFQFPLSKQVVGQAHIAYFFDPVVLQDLVAL